MADPGEPYAEAVVTYPDFPPPQRVTDWAICAICGARSARGQAGIDEHIRVKHPEEDE